VDLVNFNRLSFYAMGDPEQLPILVSDSLAQVTEYRIEQNSRESSICA